ncbi:MAG TPA: hypothetical protein VGL84_09990 [Gaiellaceae bacterium]|jgi:hypothetical protein
MTGDPALHSVEAVGGEIDRIVAERQRLRESGAKQSELEQNRQRLAEAQAQLSLLLIERHLVRV